MPLAAIAVAQQASSPPKNAGIHEWKRPDAGPATMPASSAAWIAATVRSETRMCPYGRMVPSMSVRMSFTATVFSPPGIVLFAA